MTLNPTWPGQNQANWRPPLVEGLDEMVTQINENTTAIDGIAAGGDNAIEFTQTTPLATWSITVPGSFAGRRPSVDVYDAAGVVMDPDYTATPTLVTITFPAPTSGSAVLS